MSLLNILNKTGTAMSISQTPIIGIKTGNSVLVVDGKHRLEAIRIHNLEGHGKKICFPDGLLGFFIYGQLEHHQKLTLISLAEDSVRDKKYPLTKIEIMRNSRIMLRNCPKVLGLAPLPKNGHTDYQDKSKCVTAIIDFFHVFPADLVLRNIWKTSRISDEHSEEIFKLFQTLPSGFDVNDYDVLFNKYSCAPDKVFYILRPSENNRFRKLNDIREQLKRVEKEFIPLLKDYGAYDKNLDEHEHFTHISANIRGGLAETEKTKSILVAYISSKTNNLCRYQCHQKSLNFYKDDLKFGMFFIFS
uniref:DGQHR domain-containing protein n=1 Tax=Panagrolaimus superbus TaxID=310955 RepID=A0A914YR56_9BILA